MYFQVPDKRSFDWMSFANWLELLLEVRNGEISQMRVTKIRSLSDW
jgi:hypothetical protein